MLQQDIQGPLGEHNGLSPIQHMEGGHELPVRVEGQFTQAGVLLPVGALLDTHAVTDHDEGHFSGVTHGGPLLLVGGGVAGQDGRLDQPAVDGLLHGEGGAVHQ